jgi:nitroimidazol reductase NimA-like FMN-containing flavoprotein (pyridoxamine 5'-phosphate oxidase superfamily)
MPGYGISTDPGSMLPWSFAERRLTEAHNYWVATASADGGPHLAAVWAVYLDGAVCFSTGARSRKARNLAADPRCSVTPEGAAESVVVHGTARLLPAAERERVAAAYQAKYGSGFPPDEPVYAVDPVTVIALTEADFTGQATRWRFGAPSGLS